MAGITLVIAEAKLAEALAAHASALRGETSARDRGKKPPTLDELLNDIQYWDEKVRELTVKGSRTGRRMRGATPTT